MASCAGPGGVEVEPVVAAGGEDQELEGDLELGRRGVGPSDPLTRLRGESMEICGWKKTYSWWKYKESEKSSKTGKSKNVVQNGIYFKVFERSPNTKIDRVRKNGSCLRTETGSIE